MYIALNIKLDVMEFAFWLIGSIIVGCIGGNKKIGFLGAFFCSLFLSPIIGLIITLVSGDKRTEQRENEMLNMQRKQQEAWTNLQNQANLNSALSDLERLKRMKDEGMLSEEEYDILKQKTLGITTTMGELDILKFKFKINVDDKLIYYNEEIRIEGDDVHFLISFSDNIGGDVWGNRFNSAVVIKVEDEPVCYIDKESAIRAAYLYETTGVIISEGRI